MGAFQHHIKTLKTQTSAKCCRACQILHPCNSWNWFHATRDKDAKLCSLSRWMFAPLSVNATKTNCDSGGVDPQEEHYSTMIFAKEAERLIAANAHEAADAAMFMYLAWQAVHGPETVPDRFRAPYSDQASPHYIEWERRQIYEAMVSALDEGIGRVTQALKQHDMWKNTFILFLSDNGGPLPYSNNYPLRGGKFTNWEGGTRVRSFVHSPNAELLPTSRRGAKYDGLLHVTDMYQTLMALASVELPEGGTGPVDFDGFQQLPQLQWGSASLRTEVLYAPLVNGLNPEHCEDWDVACGAALRMGDYKLIRGYPGDARQLPPPEGLSQANDKGDYKVHGGDGCNYASGAGCPCHHLNAGPCLFNVVHDPSESEDLASRPEHAERLTLMLERLDELSASPMPRTALLGQAKSDDIALQCRFVEREGCFEPYGELIPWVSTSAEPTQLPSASKAAPSRPHLIIMVAEILVIVPSHPR
eukprot:NODE_127_length_2008_cov_362.831029.p1 GENE.NODE_127_length_2008_cov_362.831029~~NODE_127_length_2008_cov_362.831029.p1  ORF type:complete len:474 (-),score=87.10 NODE_127_length_2008_cov_362.831029:569-1990(-)